MGIITTYQFSSDTETVTRTKLNNLVSNLKTEFNGNIDNANIKAAAAIAYSKLNLASSIVSTDLGSSAAMSYTTSFTNATLSSGVLTVTHSLGRQYVGFFIYDNNGLLIQPDSATATSTTVLTIDLSSFGTLTGTYNIRIIA